MQLNCGKFNLAAICTQCMAFRQWRPGSIAAAWALACSCVGLARAEVPPDSSAPCFPGAYYRKAVSSEDTWSGIEGVVTLPEFQPDMDRVNPDTGRPLDNASIYMGGRAGDTEIDAGVSWEVIKEADGKVSRIGKAYRPFWRNKDWHSGPAKPDFYYYPGDQLRIRIQSVIANKLTMSIELLNRGEAWKTANCAEPVTATSKTDSATSTAKSATATSSTSTTSSSKTSPEAVVATATVPAAGTAKANGKDFAATSPDAATSLTVTFDAPSFGPDRVQQFKRVNAIDQSGNEGKDVVATKARVLDATWHEVNLLRGRLRVPMSGTRFTDMRCPDPKYFTVFGFNDSGERICIRGAAK